MSEVYGRIIISERLVPYDKKSIKPCGFGNSSPPPSETPFIDGPWLGGIAGGDKYIAQGILFKFACDTEITKGFWMYGGSFPNDAMAMKAGVLAVESHP